VSNAPFYPAAAVDRATAAANAAVVITYPAIAGTRHTVEQVTASYSGGTPAGGTLTIEDGAGTIVYQEDVPAAGPNRIPFAPPLAGTPARALVVTLSAAGAGVIGKLNVRHRVM